MKREKAEPGTSFVLETALPALKENFGTIRQSGERDSGANGYRQQRGSYALAEKGQYFPSRATLCDRGQGVKPACDGSVRSAGGFVVSHQHIFLYSSTTPCHLPRDPTYLPSFGEEPDLMAQRPSEKEEGNQQRGHPLFIPQDNLNRKRLDTTFTRSLFPSSSLQPGRQETYIFSRR